MAAQVHLRRRRQVQASLPSSYRMKVFESARSALPSTKQSIALESLPQLRALQDQAEGDESAVKVEALMTLALTSEGMSAGSEGSTGQKPPECIELSDLESSPTHSRPNSKLPCRPSFSDVIIVSSDSEVKLGSISSLGAPQKSVRRFQPSWAASFPWAEPVYNDRGVPSMVQCTICSKLEKRTTTICMKKDNLNKHAGWKCAMRSMPKEGVMKGEWYRDRQNKHFKNEKLYAALWRDTVVGMLQKERPDFVHKKKEQFATIFWLLSNGRPMRDYPQALQLFDFLNVSCSRKHWCLSSAWGMAEAIHHVFRMRVKQLLQDARFIAMSADEVTSIDNASWISIHAYVVIDYVRVPLQLALQRVVASSGKAGSDHITKVVMAALLGPGGLTHEMTMSKLISFGADGHSVFQGCRNGVTVQIQQKYAPHMIGVHCIAHRTNLAVQAMSGTYIVARTEVLVQKLYEYFSKSSKRHLEFTKLADIMETKGKKILKHVKTRWLSLLTPSQRIISEYRTLVMKMELDDSKEATAKALLEQLCDVETLLGLACMIPLMEVVDCMIQFVQDRDVYICDFVTALRECQLQLNSMFLDPLTAFTSDHFALLHGLEETCSPTIQLKWVSDLNHSDVEHLSFQSSDISNNVWLYETNFITGARKLVTREVWAAVIVKTKLAVSGAARSMDVELNFRFPSQPVMDALGIVFPQFWRDDHAHESFFKHLVVLKAHFCQAKDTTSWKDRDQVSVHGLLTAHALDNQATMFRVAMKANWSNAMTRPITVNPLTRIWQQLGANSILLGGCPEFFKLAEIAIVMVLGSVEDERLFSTFGFVKNKIRNKLTDHMALCVQMYTQKFWTLQNFPFNDAISEWMAVRTRYNCGAV